MTGPIVLTFPPPAKAWSLNAERSMHWAERAELARTWRWAANVQARLDIPEPRRLPSSLIEVDLPVARPGRSDPHNWGGAVKAIVDGLVDAGCWPDDRAEWVTVAEPRLITVRESVVVTVIPR